MPADVHQHARRLRVLLPRGLPAGEWGVLHAHTDTTACIPLPVHSILAPASIPLTVLSPAFPLQCPRWALPACSQVAGPCRHRPGMLCMLPSSHHVPRLRGMQAVAMRCSRGQTAEWVAAGLVVRGKKQCLIWLGAPCAAGRAQHHGHLHRAGPVQGEPGRLRAQLRQQGRRGRLLLPVRSPRSPLCLGTLQPRAAMPTLKHPPHTQEDIPLRHARSSQDCP